MKKKRKLGRKLLSVLLALAMVVGLMPGMNLTAYAANNLTIYIMDMLENMDDNEWGYQLYDGDVSIAEGTYVQINMGTWHTGVMNIYMNGEVVYTKPSGSLYKDDVYHFTAGPNCKILGGYQNMFDWDGNPNVYITQDASVAVTGVTLNPNTAQTIDVGGSVAFTATVEPAGASDKTVKWSVGGTNADAVKLYSDSACTTEVGADATDKLTVYAKGISAGSATITATSNADSEKKASCDVTVNAAQTQTEEMLTTITAVGASNASTATSANVSYSTEDIATLTFSQVTPDGYGRVSYVPTWGWWGYGITLTVTPADGYTITKCVFYDDANRTATDSEAPFVVETAEEGDKAPKVNGTPILAYTSKGIKKIEVYGYATPTATHSVTITPGDNMTKTAGSGDAEQTGLTGAMTDVVYTADNGYYYPTDYSVAEVSGIKVTRDSYTQITVSGTSTADAAIALTAPTAKTTPDAPTTANATDCTTADNNDGKLTGVTTAMEYKKSDAADWTAGTDSDITGLVPGTYYVRVKATETTNASANQELTIAEYTAPIYTVTYKVVNGTWSDDSTTDKTETVQSGLSPASVPTGMKASSGYTGGAWDTNPAEATITGTTTFTYTFTAKQPATVTKVPEKKTLTYTGFAQELVTAGEATGGTMQYAIGTKDAATEPYTTSIPKKTNAGTYYVWYKVVGDDNYNDTDPKCVPVTISKADATVTAPQAKTLTYNGQSQKLVTDGTTADGTIKYALGNDAETAPADGAFSTTVPSGTNADTYFVWYKVVGDDNYNDAEPECVTATIKKAVVTVTANNLSKKWGAKDPELTYKATGLVGSDKLTGALTREAGEKVGKYAIKQGTLKANENYTLKFNGAVLTINTAYFKITFVNYDGTVLQSSDVGNGAMPKYTGKTPTKPATAQYTYTFKGWNKTITAVTGAATYTATYDSAKVKYTVTAGKCEGGKVSADKTNVAWGETVTVTPKANDGYVIKGVYLNGKQMAVNDKGKYQFEMPKNNVKVTAVFEKKQSSIVRVSGDNRFATAAAISKKTFTKADTVVLTYGYNYADALAGVPLASKLNAPILLSNTDSVPSETLAEIKRLGAKKVIILGGTKAISEKAEKQLKAKKLTTQRIVGDTRFSTAVEIAKKINTKPTEVFLVYGYNFADAISVSTVAAIKGAPIVYLPKDGELDADTAAYLKSIKGSVKKAYVIGGKSIISDSVKNKASNALGLKSVQRIAGDDRYLTCLKVNETFKDLFTGSIVCAATGTNFPDALAGGVYAAKNKAPLLLVNTAADDLSKEQLSWLKAKDAKQVTVFGGTNSVSDKHAEKIAKARV